MAKQLPKKLIVRRYKEKSTYLQCPNGVRQVINPGKNEITNPVVIAHLYDDKINQGWKDAIVKGVHEVKEIN